jgi:membrane protein
MGAAFSLLKQTFVEWREDKVSRLAAALAYYTAFSLAPLVLIAVAIAGLVLGEEAASGQIYAQLAGLLGSEGAGVIETAVRNSRQVGLASLSAIIGLVTLIWSASNVFAQLQDALNTVWEVEPKPGRGILGTIRQRFLSMTMVLGIGFLLLVSLVLSAGLAALGRYFSAALPGSDLLWQAVNFLVSFAVITLLFAAIYKVLPDVEIRWRDVWIGAAVTALLFTIGKLVIGIYLGNASVGSTFGAAGSLLVVLVWVYYSAQILFFGAEFTQVYARRYGSRIVPSPNAQPLTEEARRQQGAPSKETAPASPTSPRVPEPRPGAPAPAHATATNGTTNGTTNGAVKHGPDVPPARYTDPKHAEELKHKPGLGSKLLWTGVTAGMVFVLNKVGKSKKKPVTDEERETAVLVVRR